MASPIFILLGCCLALQANYVLGARIEPHGTVLNAKSKTRKWPDYTGYVPVTENGSSIYYAYYESLETATPRTPIILWLQGGPGCASTFGGFYEIGPWLVTEDLQLVENPATWSRKAGLLLLDQPVGTGLSIATSKGDIPRDEMGMATHLYTALQGFFSSNPSLARRPLFIMGESYAGKYVPSIAHYILQASQKSSTDKDEGKVKGEEVEGSKKGPPRLTFTRPFTAEVAPPLFNLQGVAVGNGLTEPRTQTLTLAAAAWAAGVVTSAGRNALAALALEVVALIDARKWEQSHLKREALRSALANASGVGTLFDTRRVQEYDPTQSVDRLLSQSYVREAMGARKEAPVPYTSCSDTVASVMAGDTMRPAAHLFPDILANLPTLLYQGQYDVLDGPASNTAWLEALDGWPGAAELQGKLGTLWRAGNTPTWQGDGSRSSASGCDADDGGASIEAEAAGRSGQHRAGVTGKSGGGGGGKKEAERAADGWWRTVGCLTHAVVYRAGHMVPTDAPEASQYLIEQWMAMAISKMEQEA